jgi:hypothetical protein
MVNWPVAVAFPVSKEAIVKNPPKRGDNSREGLPKAPIEKHMMLALLLAWDVKFNTIKLSWYNLAVVTIL